MGHNLHIEMNGVLNGEYDLKSHSNVLRVQGGYSGVFMGALRAEYICWSYHNAIRSFLCFAAEAITHRHDT